MYTIKKEACHIRYPHTFALKLQSCSKNHWHTVCFNSLKTTVTAVIYSAGVLGG